MSVGILLIAHSGIGHALMTTVANTFGNIPLPILQLSVEKDPDPEQLLEEAKLLIAQLDSGNGVLILTDMFGATPSNIAHNVYRMGHEVRVVAGLNLPMLFRVLNYPNYSLHQMAANAISGGKEGILESHDSLNFMMLARNVIQERLAKYSKKI